MSDPAALLAQLNAAMTDEPRQHCRMLKVRCPTCGYVVRTTRKWLGIGAPICPLDQISMEESP